MLDTSYLLLQTILVPVAVSVVTLTVGNKLGKNTGWIAFLTTLYITGILAYVTLQLFTAPATETLEAAYEWAPYVGNFTLLADGLSAPIALTIAILTMVISLYSMPYMEHEHGIGGYFTLYLLYTAGMIGTVLTTNLVAFFIFFELMLLPSWALIGIWGTGEKEKIAFKYFMFTEVGALALLAGIVTVRFMTGTFDIFKIASRTTEVSLTVLTAIAAAMLIGLLIKMAIFPLHTWLPDAHAEAPTPISALLSPAMIGIGGYAAIRILYTAFPRVLANWQFTTMLTGLALVTLVYGGVMALAQDDIKRLLAYSSISQMGYLLLGIASLSMIGLAGATLLYVSHGLSKAILFMIAGIFIHNLKTRSIKTMGGLASKMPYTATAALIAFLGLAGTPPLIGFWGEFFIFAGSMYTGFAGTLAPDMTRVAITGVAVAASVLTAAYGLWTIRRVFFGPLKEDFKDVHEASWLMVAPIIILTVLAVILGVYPTILTSIIGPIVSGLASAVSGS
jgi:NADH-quinone oxidoreductase subunit M